MGTALNGSFAETKAECVSDPWKMHLGLVGAPGTDSSSFWAAAFSGAGRALNAFENTFGIGRRLDLRSGTGQRDTSKP